VGKKNGGKNQKRDKAAGGGGNLKPHTYYTPNKKSSGLNREKGNLRRWKENRQGKPIFLRDAPHLVHTPEAEEGKEGLKDEVPWI